MSKERHLHPLILDEGAGSKRSPVSPLGQNLEASCSRFPWHFQNTSFKASDWLSFQVHAEVEGGDKCILLNGEIKS